MLKASHFRTLAFSLFVVSGLAWGQDLTKPINYTTIAVPLHKALDEISKQAGLTFYASDELDQEPVILRLQSVPTKEVMDRLAGAIGAEWQQKCATEFALVRTDKMRDQLRAEALTARASVLSAAIQRLVDEQEKTPFTEEKAASLAETYSGMLKLQEEHKPNYNTWLKVSPDMPEGRALVRVLSQIDPKALAAIPLSGRAAYSNEPTHMQLQVSIDAANIGEAFQKDQTALSSALEKAIRPQDRHQLDVMEPDPFRHIDTPPTRFVLVVDYPYYDGGGLNLKLLGFDKDNKPDLFANTTLSLDPGGMQGMMADRIKLIASVKAEPAITLSDASMAMLDHLKESVKSRGDPPPISAVLRSYVLHPEDFDPLGFITSDAFLALAESKNENAIVYPTDMDSFTSVLESMGSDVKLTTFLNDIDITHQGTLDEENGWLTYTPQDRLQAWSSRTDRHLLGECIRESDRQGYISIDTAAHLAESERNPGDVPLVSVTEFLYGRYYSPYYQRDKSTLLLYASLTDSQRKDIKSGITAGQLDKQQFQRLEGIAYSGNGGWIWQWPEGSDPNPDDTNYVMQEALLEPSESLGDGVPTSTKIQLDIKEGPTYFAGYKGSSGETFSQNQDLDGIAYTIADKALHPDQEFGQYDITWIAPGHSRQLNFNFKFTPILGKNSTLEEASRDGQDQWTMDSLPPALKKQLDDLIVQRRHQIQTSPQPDTGPATKPPVK